MTPKPPIANNAVLPGLLDVKGGVTLRDWFAAQSFHALLANSEDEWPRRLTPLEWAEKAYEYADAMMARRLVIGGDDVDNDELSPATESLGAVQLTGDLDGAETKSTRGTDPSPPPTDICGVRLSDYTCELLDGHEGKHTSGPVSWIEAAANAEALAAEQERDTETSPAPTFADIFASIYGADGAEICYPGYARQRIVIAADEGTRLIEPGDIDAALEFARAGEIQPPPRDEEFTSTDSGTLDVVCEPLRMVGASRGEKP